MSETSVNTSVQESVCPYCNLYGHAKAEECYRVQSIEYDEYGNIRRVEFHDFMKSYYVYVPYPTHPVPLSPWQNPIISYSTDETTSNDIPQTLGVSVSDSTNLDERIGG